MKKLLTILLVLLVAGFVFAAAGDATLKLTSSVGTETVHGFYATDDNVDSYSKIIGLFNGTEQNPITSVNRIDQEVDVSDTDYQNVGFYVFASNFSSGVTVNISTLPMELVGSATDFSIGYEIKFTYGDGNIVTAKQDGTYSKEKDEIDFDFTGVDGEARWAKYDVKVKFDAPDDTGLPAGEYESTITATITAE